MVDVTKVKTGDEICFKVNDVIINFEVLSVDPIMPDIYSFEYMDFDGNTKYAIVYKDGRDAINSIYGNIIKVIKRSKKLNKINYELAEEFNIKG